MTSEELAALRLRRAVARAELEQLIIRREQRIAEVEQRWTEHQTLKAAISRTCQDCERVIAHARARLRQGSTQKGRQSSRCQRRPLANARS